MSRFLFKAEYDFAHSSGRAGALDVKYKDVYIGVTRLGPFGTLRVGHFKEPYSFQFLIDAGDRTFMEEALPIVLTPGRNMGIALNHHLLDQRITWAIGAFQNVTDDSNFFGKDKQTNLTLRFTTLPLYADGGRKLVHVGGAYSHQFRRDDDTVRYQQRPETDLADQLWDTGDLPSESQDAVGAELALNLGPFWAQLETSVVYLNTMGEGSNHFKAAYVQLGFFLTGEHRPYDTALGVYTRVRPRRPVTRGGWGAWEIAARASYIDLNNKLVRGGYGDEAGAALNWYLHSSVRIGVNYLHTHRNAAGSSNIVMIRGQLHF
jgi:phosphate-selective porin OprO/OprP